MKRNTSFRQRKFYEDYWKCRVTERRLHTKEDTWIPQRIITTIDMIIQDFPFKGNKIMHVLDIGCGEGTIGKLLNEKLKDKVSIIGCDISKTALNSASNYYSKVFELDIEVDEFPDEFYVRKFNYIIILEVLEHLFKPENILKQCCRILKEGGILLASFPNIAWYKYRIDMLKGHFPRCYLFHPAEHIHHFTLNSFMELLHKNGFYPIEIDGQFVFPSAFKPRRLFLPIFKKFPNLFGYQLVFKSKKRIEKL